MAYYSYNSLHFACCDLLEASNTYSLQELVILYMRIYGYKTN